MAKATTGASAENASRTTRVVASAPSEGTTSTSRRASTDPMSSVQPRELNRQPARKLLEPRIIFLSVRISEQGGAANLEAAVRSALEQYARSLQK